jgi:hypothetical protein
MTSVMYSSKGVCTYVISACEKFPTIPRKVLGYVMFLLTSSVTLLTASFNVIILRHFFTIAIPSGVTSASFIVTFTVG